MASPVPSGGDWHAVMSFIGTTWPWMVGQAVGHSYRSPELPRTKAMLKASGTFHPSSARRPGAVLQDGVTCFA